MRIDSSGKVGIGTSSPSSYNSNSNNLVVAGSGNTGVTIAAGTSDDTNIFFSDGTSGDAQYRGIIRYSHSSDALQFHTAGANERMTIDSSGQLLLGRSANVASGAEATRIQFYNTNSTYDIASIRSEVGAGQVNRGELAFAVNNGAGQQERIRLDYSGNLLVSKSGLDVGTVGLELRADGLLAATRSGSNVGVFRRLSDDGSIVDFQKDGTTVGSIGTQGSSTYIVGASSGLRFAAANIMPTNSSGAFTDNTSDLGGSTERFKDLYLSGVVRLGTSTTYGTIEGKASSDLEIIANAGQINGNPNIIFKSSNAGGAVTERARIDASGNVGIGESSPAAALHVKTSTNTPLLLESTIASGGYAEFQLGASGATIGYLGSAGGIVTSGAVADLAVRSQANLTFATGGSAERMRITSAGELQLTGNGVLRNQESGGNFSYLQQTSSDARLFVQYSQPLLFGTNNTERMRIDASGNLLVGNTAYNTADGNILQGNGEVFSTIANSLNTLHVYDITNSVFRFYVSGGGQIHATSTSITAISDQSLKENIRDLDKGLDSILALQPRRFDWKNGNGNDIMGFIAQEVEEVMPELVHDTKYNDEETKRGLKMGDMIPSLVKAIQEQNEIINDLRARVAQLEGAN